MTALRAVGPPKTVRCGIGLVIGLDLDDAAADAVEQQRRPDQVGRNLVHAAAEEGSGQTLRHAPSSQAGASW
jgi:hypothetical protein